jgi:hypothetical protein
MIATAFYSGQGFGNQLWVYAATRAIAQRNGYEFGIAQNELFKGSSFLNLDFGKPIKIPKARGPLLKVPPGFDFYYKEKQVFHPILKCDVTPLDPDLLNVKDGTFIDGYMQSEGYLLPMKEQLGKMLAVPDEYFDGCTISLRGGEYRGIKNVFLPKSYYLDAINSIKEIDPATPFRVVTDDPKLAKEYFPEFPVISSGGVKIYAYRWYRHPESAKVGRDFSSIQNSKYLILSNSSFSWWGAWTNQHAVRVIAPKYWAEFNRSTGYWSQGNSLTQGWEWLDKKGNLCTWEECVKETQL